MKGVMSCVQGPALNLYSKCINYKQPTVKAGKSASIYTLSYKMYIKNDYVHMFV